VRSIRILQDQLERESTISQSSRPRLLDSMSSYLNNYEAPSTDIPRDCHLHTPLEEYDHNYIFGVKPLRSDRVEMRPFIVRCYQMQGDRIIPQLITQPSLHAQLLFDGLTANPDITRWLSMPPLKELNDVLAWAERVFRRNPVCVSHWSTAISTSTPTPTLGGVPQQHAHQARWPRIPHPIRRLLFLPECPKIRFNRT